VIPDELELLEKKYSKKALELSDSLKELPMEHQEK
jgi:hypothetical protein